VKASGLGHEGGYRSIDFYTDQQAVHITLGPAHNPTFGKADPSAGSGTDAAEQADAAAKVQA
jgi:5-carboxymethyl-2-hydroxymuconic-semialdehyde dehydrogenase